jgi:UDP-glucose 4-epimerase
VDVVYHLAARVSVPESILYPRDYNMVNVGGTVALMEAMRDVGVRRVVLASSGPIYGDLGKLSAEYYVRTIGSLWGIETVSLRIFNAYGPGQHLPPSHPPVVPHFLKQAQRGGTLVVHGDGNQTRDYVYVDDVVSAMVAASTAPNVDGLAINVGSGQETSVRELVKCVMEVTGSNAEVLYNTQTSGGVSRLCADLKLAGHKLNYSPSISLSDGLRLTLKRDSRFK